MALIWNNLFFFVLLRLQIIIQNAHLWCTFRGVINFIKKGTPSREISINQSQDWFSISQRVFFPFCSPFNCRHWKLGWNGDYNKIRLCVTGRHGAGIISIVSSDDIHSSDYFLLWKSLLLRFMDGDSGGGVREIGQDRVIGDIYWWLRLVWRIKCSCSVEDDLK